MNIESTKKYWEDDESHFWTRIKAPIDTLKEIIPISNKIGVTRVSDITHMDKLQIPNFSAVLPGTEDSIWVYSGKGPTKLQARAGALMESIERYCSLFSNNGETIIEGTYHELSKIYKKVLHPEEVVEAVEPSFNDRDSIVAFVPGYDLITNEDILVPAQLAYSKYTPTFPSTKLFSYSHTNGLASGNVLEEAICHALFEVIERDAVSIAELSASSIPYTILTRISNFFKSQRENTVFTSFKDKFVDDSSIFPDVDITEIARESDVIKFLVRRFTEAGINLLVKNITQDIGIPTFVASSIEWVTSDYGYFAKGYGTHLDARIALIRAITELSQTRATNIQGARDDLKRIKYRENDEIYKRKWEFMPNRSTKNTKSIMFSEIKSRINRDIRDDIKYILKSLKRAGLNRAIIVNLTNPQIGIPVVRAVVPGLETFEVAKLFTNTNLVIGNRARKHFQSILGD